MSIKWKNIILNLALLIGILFSYSNAIVSDILLCSEDIRTECCSELDSVNVDRDFNEDDDTYVIYRANDCQTICIHLENQDQIQRFFQSQPPLGLPPNA